MPKILFDPTATVPIPAPKQWFINYYCCDYCNQDWIDEWDSMSDSECPVCGKDISPYKSEEVVDKNG